MGILQNHKDIHLRYNCSGYTVRVQHKIDDLAEAGHSQTAVCFLIINRISELPSVAITSVLEKTERTIYVGYCKDDDLIGVPRDSRVIPIKLSHEFRPNSKSLSSEVYANFDIDRFYQLVTLKWNLLDMVFDLGYMHVIYSDIDVVWMKNVANLLCEAHIVCKNVDIFIQGFTVKPSEPQLCMGLLSVRNTPRARAFLAECQQTHLEETSKRNYIGDDDVITFACIVKVGIPLGFRSYHKANIPLVTC